MSAISRFDVMQRIKVVMTETGSWEAAARRLGVPPDHLVRFAWGNGEPSKKLLTALRIRKVVMYEELP